MQNLDLARHFDEYADLLEIQGANPFRIRAYRNAARTIGDLTVSVAQLATSASGLCELPGIGKDLAEKICALIATGTFPQLEELRQEVPAGVRELMRVPGLGPKKAVALFRELQIQSLEQLREAATGGRIAPLKGFGKKTEQAILKGLETAASVGFRILLPVAKTQVDQLVADLRQFPGVGQAEAAGSVRRRRETIGDLDVLATADSSAPVMDFLASHAMVQEVLARGDTKQHVRLHSGLELDLRVVPHESWGAALQYFTGSKDHNIVMRRRAQERGLKINEYGVFREETSIAGATEHDVYATVGLPYIPPELREGRFEFELADAGRLPRLLEVDDLKGDLHMHTTATDGTATIAEMIAAARDRGLEYIAITDHSQRVAMANGLTAERLRAHWREIDRVREQFPGIQVLRGIECDILEDARLDLPDDVLDEADWVIAVLHYGLNQPREQIMQRLLAAVGHPSVDLIGHPSGRLVGKRPAADIDWPVFLRAAADHGVMLEINASPHRLDLDDMAAAAARELGILMCINTDAHSTGGLDVMEYGVYQARRAGLSTENIANTRPWPEFKNLLRHGP